MPTQKDGQTLFYRTLPTIGRGPNMLIMEATFTTTIKYKIKFSYWHLRLSRTPSSEDMKVLKRQNLIFDFYLCVSSTLTFKISPFVEITSIS